MITAQKIGEMASGADGTMDGDDDTLAGMNKSGTLKKIKMPSNVSVSSRGSGGSRR